MNNWEIIKRLVLDENIETVFQDESVDIDSFVLFLKRNKLILLYYDKIRKYLPDLSRKCLETEYDKIVNKIKYQISYAKDLIEILKNHKYVFMKGFCLSQFIYSSAYKRVSSDIDIFCDENNIIDICKKIDKFGIGERYIEKLENVSEYEKNMYYLGDIEKVYKINDDIKIEVKTTANGIDNHAIKKMVQKLEYMEIDNAKFPVLSLQDTFFRFIDNIGENSNVNRAIFFGWKIRDVIDFYYCIKNNFSIIIQYDYTNLEKRIYYRLLRMLYFVSNLIDEKIVLQFCNAVGIDTEYLNYNEKGISLNSYDLPRLFFDKEYLKNTFVKLKKRFILDNNANVLDGKYINKYIDIDKGDVWFNKVPWMHPVIINKYKISSSIGICFDKEFMYFNICLSPIDLTYMFRLRFMNTDSKCEQFYFDIRFIIDNKNISIFDKDSYFNNDDIRTYLNIKDNQYILTIGIRLKDEIILRDNINNIAVSFMNIFGYLYNRADNISTFFLKNINYDDFEKIMMDI